MGCHVAGDRPALGRFAGRAGTEFEENARTHIARARRQRGIFDEKHTPTGRFHLCIELGGFDRAPKDRRHLFTHPAVEPRSDILGPALLLAVTFGPSILGLGDEVGRDLANVVSEVDVLGEAVDRTIGFRKRRTALEHQMRIEARGTKHRQRPDHHHIFFKKMRRSAAFARSKA